MQTFLPYDDFCLSAKHLDYRRLGKQRVETLQILMSLLGESKGWVNHPATKMWRHHEHALVDYGIAMCCEWINRGYKDTCLSKILNLRGKIAYDNGLPSWMGDRDFHASHQSNLLRKDSAWYSQWGWTVPDNLEYVWPI